MPPRRLTWPGAPFAGQRTTSPMRSFGRGATLSRLAHEGLGKLPYTTAPWLADKVPWQVYRRAPRLGEHNADIYRGELGIEDHTLQQLRATNVTLNRATQQRTLLQACHMGMPDTGPFVTEVCHILHYVRCRYRAGHDNIRGGASLTLLAHTKHRPAVCRFYNQHVTTEHV